MHQTGWSWLELEATPEPVLTYYRAIGTKAAEIRRKTTAP